MNAADPKEVKKQKKKDHLDQLQFEAACAYVMQNPKGRHFVWSLLERCGLYQMSFTGNSETFFREGRRSIGLEMIADLEEVTPLEFLDMWSEHFKKAREKVIEKLDAEKQVGKAEKESDDASEDKQE
jgi:hypothetical protein